MCKSLDIYNSIAEQIKREDANVTNRINWFLASQAFILTGIGLIVRSKPEAFGLILEPLSYAGLIVSLSVLLGIVGAEISIEKTKKFYEEQNLENFPLPFGGRTAWAFGIIPRIAIPFSFIYFWWIGAFESSSLIDQLMQNQTVDTTSANASAVSP